ncbi:hypothetical protein F183_A02400 [Bryobacterales bacterium F-183]|nr:hypothetical protein F183_A02400 [Bryobacterales bacterium F-183]
MPDWRALRYWAGQKLLHSPFHPLYLRLTGQTPVPKTYARYVAAERPGPSQPLDQTKYEIVTEPGVQLAPDAAYWLMREAENTGASRIYADEDCIGRHSPVFRPQWSPELAAHCDYIGGNYLRRLDENDPSYASVTRVLFHRPTPRTYPQTTPPTPQIHTRATAIICSRDPQLLATCLTHLTNIPVVAVLHTGQGRGDDPQLRLTAQRFANVTAIEYTEPFHFARMCNLGAKQVRSEHLLFLNDDVTPQSPDWLQRMIAQAEKPNTGAVGALLYYPDGRLQHAGVMVGTPMGAGHPGRLSSGAVPHWPWLTMTREVSAVTGACLLMPKKVFHAIDGFDEIFPVNYNDVDLCLRTAAKGYRILLEGNAKMVHAESATRKTGIGYTERQTFLQRWSNKLSAGDPYLNPNLSDDELIQPDPKAL